MITGCDGGHPIAHLLDYPSALVSQHHRQFGPAHRAIHDVQTAVTDAAGGETNEHLARVRLVEINRFHRERLAHAMQHRGLNLLSLEHAGHGNALIDSGVAGRYGCLSDCIPVDNQDRFERLPCVTKLFARSAAKFSLVD